jgi:hypothetical protein
VKIFDKCKLERGREQEDIEMERDVLFLIWSNSLGCVCVVCGKNRIGYGQKQRTEYASSFEDSFCLEELIYTCRKRRRHHR